MKYLLFFILFFSQLSAFVKHHPESDSSMIFRYPNNKVLYLYMMKNASTFVRNMFNEKFVHEYSYAIPDQVKKDYIKLLIVRDPYSRAISSYLEVIKARSDGPESTIHYPFFHNRGIPTSSFIQFLTTIEDNFYDNHCKPQYKIYQAMGFDLEDVDFIVDFKTLEQDLKLFSEKFNIPLNFHEFTYAGNSNVKTVLKQFVNNNQYVQKEIERIYHMDFDFYEKCLQRRKQILKNPSCQ